MPNFPSSVGFVASFRITKATDEAMLRTPPREQPLLCLRYSGQEAKLRLVNARHLPRRSISEEIPPNHAPPLGSPMDG